MDLDYFSLCFILNVYIKFLYIHCNTVFVNNLFFNLSFIMILKAALFNFVCRCVLAAPYLACLKGDNSLAIVFLVHLFDTNAQPQSVTINTIFGAGAQGPYKLESVLGEEPVISINADNDQRKRILVIGELPIPIQRDIAGDATLYVVSIDNEKVLLETTHKIGVNTLKYATFYSRKNKRKIFTVAFYTNVL